MKRKILFILVLLSSCFLTGCTATYTMTIDEKISDELNIYMSDSEYKTFNSDPNNYLIMQYANQNGGHDTYNGEKISGISYYDMLKDDEKKIITFTSTFDDDKVNESALIKNTFIDYVFRASSDEIYIKTDTGFMFPHKNLTNVKVVLHSPYKVLHSNADSQNGEDLIWNINKSNSSSKYIEVNYDIESDEEKQNSNALENEFVEEENYNQDENKSEDNDQNQKSTTSYIVGVIVLAVFTIILLIIVTILKQKKSNLNKI